MNTEDLKAIKIRLHHQLIGNQVFDIEVKDSLSEFRNMLTQNTPLTLYENYHFQYQGNTVSEYQQIGQMFEGDVQMNIVMDNFTQRSSRYHARRVKKIINNPLLWAIFNCKDPQESSKNSKNYLDNKIQLDGLLEKTLTSPILNQPNNYRNFPPIIQSFNYSGYNPPPYYRKLAGDFYYLHIRTLENIDYYITANPEGFYLNQSTNTSFQPLIQVNRPVFCSLLNLLLSISPKSKEMFKETMKAKVTQFQKMLISVNESEKVCEWLKEASNLDHQWCCDSLSSERSYHHHVDLISIKDWNELFQLQCVLPTDTLFQRLNKEKLKYKLYQEFIEYAKDGTMHIVEGKILPYSPLKKQYLYVYGSLMYTVTSQELPKGKCQAGPLGKFADCQLKNLAIIDKMSISELHLSHAVIVKYRGFKVIVQSIIPGILGEYQNSQQKNTSNDSEKLKQIVKKVCKELQMSEDIEIVDSQGKIKKIIAHPKLKVFQGNDKRKYITDLLNLSPRDYNYLGVQNQACLLRPQIIQIYRDKQKCPIGLNPLLETSFSKNLCSTQKLASEQQKLKSIAKYVKEIMVPLCINKLCNSMRKYLSDSKGIVYVMHTMGLSCRYLGNLYQQAGDENLHFKAIIQRIIMVKTLKNIMRMVFRQCDLAYLKMVVCRILNCVFGKSQLLILFEKQQTDTNLQKEESINKKKKKKNKQKDDFLTQVSIPTRQCRYLNIKPSQLWQTIKKMALIRFSHKFPQRQENCSTLNSSKFNKIALLRDLCLSLGMIMERKQYFSDEFTQFMPSNVLQFRPICKTIPIQCHDLTETILEGDRMANLSQVQQAIDSYNRAMQYIVANFGGLHQKLAIVHKKVSNIYFKIGEIDTALLFANHSCQIFQTVYGADHIQTIQNYTLLSFYNYSKKNYAQAEYFLLKSIHHIYCAYGQYYPELIVDYLNLSTIYQGQKKYTDAIISIINALNLSVKIFGEKHIHVAICYSALATLHYDIPDIQQAIKYQTKVVQSLSNVSVSTINNEDIKLKEARSILEYFRSVQLSKKVKQIHQKEQKKLNQQLYNGMSLFKMSEPNYRQKQQFLSRMQKIGRKKFY